MTWHSEGTPVGEDDLLLDLIYEARAALDDLEKGVLDRNPDSPTYDTRGSLTAVELVRRARHGTRDGYPRQSMGGGSGGLAGNPVAELVTSDPMSDPIRRAAVDMKRLLKGAVGDLRVAVGTLAKAEPPSPKSTPSCRVHAGVGIYEPAWRGDRCRWCNDFFAVEGVDPPDDLLLAKDRGERITTKMVKEALAALRAPKRRKGRRGRR